MKSFLTYISVLCSVILVCFPQSDASVFLPNLATSQSSVGLGAVATVGVHSRLGQLSKKQRTDIRLVLQKRRNPVTTTAMAIPGYGVAEQVFVGGFMNFLSAYNFLITGTILLSWFPQARGVGLLQPLFTITDPFLNLFRGVIPPIFGLDFSPIAAFFLLNLVTQATAAVGCELPESLRNSESAFYKQNSKPTVRKFLFERKRSNKMPKEVALNY